MFKRIFITLTLVLLNSNLIASGVKYDFQTAYDNFDYYQAMSLNILSSIYESHLGQDSLSEYYSINKENLSYCKELVVSHFIEQSFKNDLVKYIIENKHNKSFYGLLWYIQGLAEADGRSKEFENKLGSEPLRMILEHLEQNAFSDLPLLRQSQWVDLIKRKYIESVKSEQSSCCIS